MEFLSTLWMPILVSAVAVFFVSFLTHMVLPHHKSEWKALPDEAKVLEALAGVPPDQYMFPHGTMADMKEPAFMAKMRNGPNGTMTIWPGPVNMGRNLGLTFIYYVVIGLFVAYLASLSMPPGTEFMHVFRMTATMAFMAHGLGWMSHAIWYGWKGFWADLFDAILYSAVTGAVFGWLWPKIAALAS